MEPRRIEDERELEEAFRAPLFLLVKHSLICPVSGRAFHRYGAFLGTHPGLASAWIDVIGQRPLARAVAERTGIRHESPQAILLRAGRAVWHASHDAITEASLAQALAEPAQPGT